MTTREKALAQACQMLLDADEVAEEIGVEEMSEAYMLACAAASQAIEKDAVEFCFETGRVIEQNVFLRCLLPVGHDGGHCMYGVGGAEAQWEHRCTSETWFGARCGKEAGHDKKHSAWWHETYTKWADGEQQTRGES